jgi:hypothetical protein
MSTVYSHKELSDLLGDLVNRVRQLEQSIGDPAVVAVHPSDMGVNSIDINGSVYNGPATEENIADRAVTADKISADAIDTKSLTAVSMQGTMTDGTIDGTDFLVDDSGGRILIYQIAAGSSHTVTLNTVGAGNWTIPTVGGNPVAITKVECWGAGQGGQGGYSSPPSIRISGMGGVGGGYGAVTSFDMSSYIAGGVIPYSIGQGGSGSTDGGSEGGIGGDTWFGTSTTVKGYGGDSGHGGRSGIGSTRFTGGDPGIGVNTTSSVGVGGGGGGEGAASNANGKRGSNAPSSGGSLGDGGAGGSGTSGGNGGAGGDSGHAGSDGSLPGGAGGGGGVGSGGATHAGGAGGNGQIKITYADPGGLKLVGSIAQTAGRDNNLGSTGLGNPYPVGCNIQPRYYTYRTYSKALVSGTADTVSSTTQVVLMTPDGSTTSRFSSGTMVVPSGEGGIYDIHFFSDNLLTNANNARMSIQVNGSNVARAIYTGGGGGVNTFSVTATGIWLNAGDVVSFSLITAGPNLTCTGFITIKQVYCNYVVV